MQGIKHYYYANSNENIKFGVVIEYYADMKNFILLLFSFFLVQLSAQHTISGNFSPAEKYTWLIAYHIKPGSQSYIADAPIKEGGFNMTIPENSPKGTYRLVYAVPQEEFNFDILYSGEEDISLSFTMDQGVVFNASKENILFNTYFKKIQEAKQNLHSFYSNNTSNKIDFKKITKNYRAIQQLYFEKSKGLMAHEFIKANAAYIPTKYEPFNQYVENTKNHYFDNLEVTNKTLQASRFLTDKLINYVFSALPPKELTSEEKEKNIVENIETVEKKLKNTSDRYQFSTLYALWEKASLNKQNNLSDSIYHNYLKPRAISEENKKIIVDIELKNRLRFGAAAPEIEWQNGENKQRLSALEGFENYVLVFWSSTCGHCLRELPALHQKLKENKKVKVIAIGLEDDETTWKVASAKLAAFEHAISLGKWQSKYADLYGIESTPTYFILDADKKINHKPESQEAVVKVLED